MKNRFPFLKEDSDRFELCRHIKANAEEWGIYLDTVNGWHEHLHCLISLKADQKLADVVKLIKGESSKWLKTLPDFSGFTWQDDYWAVSVSESQVSRVRKYIKAQAEHHKYMSFEEEASRFARMFGTISNLN